MRSQQTCNSLPQQKQRCVLPLVFRSHEGTSQFQRRAERFEQTRIVAEARARIESPHSMLRENLGRVPGSVSAHQFLLRFIPQQHMPVIAVEPVEIAALARTFTGQAKRHFAQPSQLLQGSRRLVRLRQIDHQIAVLRQTAVRGKAA